MMNKKIIAVALIIAPLIMAFKAYKRPTGKLIIHFVHTADNKKICKDSTYSNAFGEQYSVTKLKYYVSNMQVGDFKENNSYHLIDAFAEDSIVLTLPEGKYNSIRFLLGVDSAKNCSGAQSGALDPLNDMFWTWNSGYVMFKLEGTSPNSTADLQRIEQHIGGYKGPYKTMRQIQLSFNQSIEIAQHKISEAHISVNLDKYWHGKNDLSIAAQPLLMVIGEKSKNAADNFIGMFSVIEK